jgi:hypothetical protein
MKATFHPNGFFVRVLHQFSNGMRLRLHTWPADRSDRSDPHDHRTWFISLPLCGRFIEHRYREVPGSIPIYKCRVTTGAERLDVHRDGQSGLERIETKIRYPGIPYYCSKEVIHSYSPARKRFAASLVLFGPTIGKIPKAWII